MKDEELNPILAKKMLDEWSKIQRMKFWQRFMAKLKEQEQKTKNAWGNTGTGTLVSPLFEKWLKLYGELQGFKKAVRMPDDLAKDCEEIIKGE